MSNIHPFPEPMFLVSFHSLTASYPLFSFLSLSLFFPFYTLWFEYRIVNSSLKHGGKYEFPESSIENFQWKDIYDEVYLRSNLDFNIKFLVSDLCEKENSNKWISVLETGSTDLTKIQDWVEGLEW